MERCWEAGRERQELSPCSRSSLKACFVQVFSVSDSKLKHFASLCSEAQRRSTLSSGLLLSRIHSCYKLSPDIYNCQSCRSSCASTKPAGAFLLPSLVRPAHRCWWDKSTSSAAGCWATEPRLHRCHLSRAGTGGEEKERQSNQRPIASTRARTKTRLAWPWQHPPLPPCWSHWSSVMFGVGPWASPSCHGCIMATRASVYRTPGVVVQRKPPSATAPQHQNRYQSQLGWAYSSSRSSPKAVCLTALWVMNKPQETRASHSSWLTTLPTTHLAACLLGARQAAVLILFGGC